MKYNGWKFYLRIIGFTWILADVLAWKMSFEWALMIALPFGMLLFTTRDDVEAKEANKRAMSAKKRPASRQA